MMETAISIAPEGPLIVPPLAANQTALSVIVPTLEESGNIDRFLRALCGSLDLVLKGRYEIVVLDDDSRDGTLERAGQVAVEYPQIQLARREGKRELATAVIRGWQLAKGSVLATINADFQHPPELIAGMWQMVPDADLVVASRYCKGGSEKDWTLSRRILSRCAQLLGVIILPEVFGRVTDPLSGCFMLRRAAISSTELNPRGYKSLIEVLVRGRVQNIAEVPYRMRTREWGSSKANGARSLDYVLQLLRLRKVWRNVTR
jgi:dolichol-phosphate mannosyltransferase